MVEITNLADMNVQAFELETYEVNEYYPQADGAGKATEVHVLFQLKGTKGHLGVRIKSREALDELISMLQDSAQSVWPEETADERL